MNIIENASLKDFNTFGINATARYLVVVEQVSDLLEVQNHEILGRLPYVILGGGSNVVFVTNYFDGVVLKNELRGIEILSEDEHFVKIRAYSGEPWHEFVLWCLERNYGGLENLSLIPGCVGAAPIQNIGAYGVEVQDVIEKVEVINLVNFSIESLSKEECKFSYRDSIFKHRHAYDEWFIQSIVVRLTVASHRLHTEYGAIREALEAQNIENPTIKDVSNAVIEIRNAKLPNPKMLGNAGSFFKNPVVDAAKFKELKRRYPDVVSYPVSETEVKIPAGWLIEKCGFKGLKIGEVGCYEKQALVIVNYGAASGKDVYYFSQKVRDTVLRKFEIRLEQEVNIIK